MDNRELKPCPFCGNRNVTAIGVEEPGRDIYCSRCYASVAWLGDCKDDAIAAWNRRAALSPTGEHPVLSQEEREALNWADQPLDRVSDRDLPAARAIHVLAACIRRLAGTEG